MDPSADEIRLQLDRVLASGVFANADWMSGFLRYVVSTARSPEKAIRSRNTWSASPFSVAPRHTTLGSTRLSASKPGGCAQSSTSTMRVTGDTTPSSFNIVRASDAPTFERRAAAAAPTAHLPINRSAPAVTTGGLGSLRSSLRASSRCRWVWRSGSRDSGRRLVGRRRFHRIAVLPFTEYSSGTAEALLAARLTEGVTSELARVRTLGVASYTSAQQFVGTRRPLREIAS